MTIRKLLFCGLSLLIACTANALGQNLIQIQFSGEVTGANSDERYFFAQIGDPVSGTLTFDPFTEELSEVQSPYYDFNSYDFRAGKGAQFVVDVRGQVLSSKPVVKMGQEERFVCELLQQHVHPGDADPGCTALFKKAAWDEDLETSSKKFELNFIRQNCHLQPHVNKLSKFILNPDWDEITLKAFFREDGVNVGFRANISEIKIVEIQYAAVVGSLFVDENSNCAADDTQVLGNRLLKFTPGPHYALSDAAGEYTAPLPLGTYAASPVKQALWNFTCVDGPAELKLESVAQTLRASYAMEPEQLVQALDISLAAGQARPGFAFNYSIRLENVGTLPYRGTLRFQHDALLENFTSSPEADDYLSPVAEWYIDELAIGAVQYIYVYMQLPADETLLGSVVCASVDSEIDSKVEDEILRLGSDKVCTEIRGAYDPNDIQVFSGTQSADGAITRDDRILTYLIRFQNEGNESAITVRVLDKLSEFHNIESLRLGASSHAAEVSINNDGALEWTFNDINLLPKSVDEAASQGFVKFEVTLKDELAVGTEIPNSAAIYFDFNSPVITNTVVSRLLNTTTSVTPELDASAVRVYPNPSADKVIVRLEQVGHARLTLRNVLGQHVLTETANSAVHELDLRDLAAGSYFLMVKSAAGSLVKAVNVAR